MPRNPLDKDNSYSTITSLPRPQKIAVIILAILAVLIIVFWILQFRYQINKPFKSENSKNSVTNITTNPQEQDTDHDGLSDYEEINVYNTSPYLEDSDSDGLTDKQEVDRGSDPNCPAGQQCSVIIKTPSETEIIQPDLSITTESVDNEVEAILQSALSGNIDAASLRQLLISSGADQEMLDQISDEDLMQSYQETLEKQEDNQ